MTCYRNGGCGPYEMYSCNERPASKPEYLRTRKTIITNGDRIRAMTDEELAELLEGPYGNMLPHTALGWLKEEADDGN